MKPLIFVLGAPHSMTSMTARFLIANGCGSGLDETKISNYTGNDVCNYISCEDWPIRTSVNRMRKFKYDEQCEKELKEYLSFLPKDETIIIKVPWAVFFLDKLQSYTKKPIKIVYCMRNQHDVIVSSFEKGNDEKGTFFRLFHLYNSMYRAAIESGYPLFILPVERLANRDENTGWDLLYFCLDNLPTLASWSTIDQQHIKKRKSVYLNYRMSNFVFMIIDRITKRMN